MEDIYKEGFDLDLLDEIDVEVDMQAYLSEIEVDIDDLSGLDSFSQKRRINYGSDNTYNGSDSYNRHSSTQWYRAMKNQLTRLGLPNDIREEYSQLYKALKH